jgi:asparagine synthase (glutamine-hydrolysing)
MCGICGIFDAHGQGAAQAPLVRRMADSLSHRGPDNDGFYESPHCVLGHRRLKIIDLSPLGRQPMTNEDESVWISFNGEIYNYLDLRPELIRRGHHFRSRTDTEVILHLYEDEGEDFLRDLNGMFALALWDQRRGSLLLARDRWGKKPIYYYSDGHRLLFGSEMKALLADPSVPRDLDFDAVSTYLSLGYIPCPSTIFRGIQKLPPASYVVVDRDPSGQGLRLRGPMRYWTLRYQPNPKLTENDCVGRIRELIRDAVRIRMYSDVPLGAFLSGGLDSSTVVAAMAENSAQPVETFSIGFDEASFDELPYAEAVAKKFRTKHHVFRCTPNMLEVLPTLVHHYDEPFADASALPTYYVSKIAREHVTVALSGDGGDETFAGYTRYDNGTRRWEWAQYLPEPLIRGAFRILTELYPAGSRGWGILHRNSLSPLDSYMADVSTFQPREKQALLEPGLGASAKSDVFALARGLAAQTGSAEFLSEMQYVDQMLYLPDDILVKVDRASMAVSLETRAPLLDYRLGEFLATVPAALRYRKRSKKHLLKQAMEGILPAEIIHRGKMGFGVPLKHWFRKDAADFARDILLSQAARERGFFRAGEVARALDRHAQGRRDFSGKLWALLFFELWCRTWLDRTPTEIPDEMGATRCAAI